MLACHQAFCKLLSKNFQHFAHLTLLLVSWLPGFSQGAALASLVLAQCQKDHVEPRIKFAILVSANSMEQTVLWHSFTCHDAVMCISRYNCHEQVGAFLPKDPQYAHMMTTQSIGIPTLFISGNGDQLIPAQRTEELIATFDPESAQRYVHSGGHMVPTCTGDFKTCLQDFLDKHGKSQFQ